MKSERDIAERIAHDRSVRRAVTRESFYWFFHVYFSHYVKYATAPFQKEMFSLLESDIHQTLVFVAFRGSGKSTIVTMAYVLWAILGRQEKKYSVITGQTQWQARQHLQNIKQELERNDVLRGDLGPFREERDDWGSLSLVLSNYGAKITAASTEQSIRGMRHGAYRPDLIVCDDVEDLSSVKTLESREKTYRWFTGDVVPSGDRETRVIVVGNLLHEDSLIMRLRKNIEQGNLAGLFREYPLLDTENHSLWPGKFSDEGSIQTEKKKVGSYNAWMREYMLQILPEDDQIVLSEWIHSYETLPNQEDLPFCFTVAAVDPAISKEQSADSTAIITAKVYGYAEKRRIYILPYPINKRLNFSEQLETIKRLVEEYQRKITLLIENNGYQRALVEMLEKERYPVKGVQNIGQDKRARISLITPHLKSGLVLFPKNGADALIQQLVGFGVEKHDDLADALATLVTYCVENNRRSARESLELFVKMNPHLQKYDPGSLWNKRF